MILLILYSQKQTNVLKMMGLPLINITFLPRFTVMWYIHWIYWTTNFYWSYASEV